MRSKELSDYIQQHQALFWYTPPEKLEAITLSFLTETVLNWGSLDDVRELFVVAGLSNVAKVFRASIQKSTRHNYFAEVENFFSLYFDKYAPASIE